MKNLNEIRFFEVTIEDWINLRDNENYTFWIIFVDNNCLTGYFKGFDGLNDEDVEHFLEYRNYYYYRSIREMSVLDDKYITKDMLIKNTYEGNYYAKKNAVMYDLQNGKQNVVCFCDNIYTAQGIVEGLNMLDKLEADGVELKK